MKNKYRIVKDAYAGYEVQIKFWWLPFIWLECNFSNTHANIGMAKEFI